jgi:hypothetical protein
MKVPVLCRQGNCKSSFTTLFNFMRHVKSFHNNDGQQNCLPVEPVSEDSEPLAEEENRENDFGDFQCTSEESHDFLQDVRSEGFSLVAGLRANSIIPYCVITCRYC